MLRKIIGTNRIIPLAVIIVSLTVLLTGARPRAKANKQQAEKGPSMQGPMLMLTKEQPNSPLIISDVLVEDSPDPTFPAVSFKITNRSNKGIIAFAIRHDAALRQGPFSGAEMTNYADREHALLPGQSSREETGGINYGEPVISMTLSIDFVEFVNGIRWGPDSFKSGDSRDGLLAGQHAEREMLLKVLLASGFDALMRDLEALKPEDPEISEHSYEWLRAFRIGVNVVRGRVRDTDNLSDVEKDLRRRDPVLLRKGWN